MLIFERGGTPDPRIPPALLSPRRDTSRAWVSLFVRPGQRLIFRFSADILPLFETSSNDDDDDLHLFFITHRKLQSFAERMAKANQGNKYHGAEYDPGQPPHNQFLSLLIVLPPLGWRRLRLSNLAR
jgi:hypothetical protein